MFAQASPWLCQARGGNRVPERIVAENICYVCKKIRHYDIFMLNWARHVLGKALSGYFEAAKSLPCLAGPGGMTRVDRDRGADMAGADIIIGIIRYVRHQGGRLRPRRRRSPRPPFPIASSPAPTVPATAAARPDWGTAARCGTAAKVDRLARRWRGASPSPPQDRRHPGWSA